MVEGEEVTRHRGAARQIVKRAVGQALAEAIAQLNDRNQRIVVSRLADHVVHRLEQRDLQEYLAMLTAEG